MWHKFLPFLAWWPLVGRDSLRADLLAGLTGAVIVLPQGVAFAMIAGLPPEYGLYTAMVTPIVAALFGSSLHLISGPTTAISIVVFSAISHHAEPGTAEFISLTLTLTFLAGVYQLAFGLARLGSLVNFVSHSVVVAFTAGAAILIMTSQLKHVLGVYVPKGESFLHTWVDVFNEIGDINYYILIVALSTLISALLFKRFFPRLPYMLLAMILGSLVSLLLNGEAHGVHLVGEMPAHLPPLSMPDFSIATIRQLAPEAFAVALLGLIEAVSIARSVASKSNQHIDGNQEFMGQGLSNIAGSFFSSYAGSGSFTRSGINYQTGAKTPLSAIFAAVFLALTILLIAPLTAYLPIAAMGGIILLVGYNLIDFHHIKGIIKASHSEASVLLVTFLATLFLELEFAIYAGILLSLVFYLNQTARPKIVTLAPDPEERRRHLTNIERKALPECPQLRVIRIDGSLFFGAVSYTSSILHRLKEKEPTLTHLLILAKPINFIDVAGAEMLVQEAKYWKTQGGGLYLCGLKMEADKFLRRGGYLDKIGEHNLFTAKKEAIAEIFKHLDHQFCQTCERRIFRECQDIKSQKFL
ncbi:MAG TPA: SulP family inorganic anion transporter [Thiotrichaceae bacterium]|nr:SulP family inorganic anion transporter [Thiotrichaceae bacterium]